MTEDALFGVLKVLFATKLHEVNVKFSLKELTPKRKIRQKKTYPSNICLEIIGYWNKIISYLNLK